MGCLLLLDVRCSLLLRCVVSLSIVGCLLSVVMCLLICCCFGVCCSVLLFGCLVFVVRWSLSVDVC